MTDSAVFVVGQIVAGGLFSGRKGSDYHDKLLAEPGTAAEFLLSCFA